MRLLLDLWRNRIVLWELALYDFKHEYLGTWFGILWAFANPILTAVILWFVFSHGLRGGGDSQGYFLWLTAGLFPWQFLANSLRGGTLAIVNHSFLVRKLAFRVEFLPFVKIISASLLHLPFALALVLIALFQATSSFLLIQMIYYWFAGAVLCLAITRGTAAITVFVKDFAGAVEVILQLAFLGTPIFWRPQLLPQSVQDLLFLNPLYYIVSGYRSTVVEGQAFWQNPIETFFFWGLTLGFLLAGGFVFRKLRPIFADHI
ncbi:MAG: ABC transporter permease [Leptospirales bacterium]|nr:ABC transporter permease [Leptospirales bacterium]